MLKAVLVNAEAADSAVSTAAQQCLLGMNALAAVFVRGFANVHPRLLLVAADVLDRYTAMREAKDVTMDAATSFVSNMCRRLSSRLFFVVSCASGLSPPGFACGLRLMTTTLLLLLGEGSGAHPSCVLWRCVELSAAVLCVWCMTGSGAVFDAACAVRLDNLSASKDPTVTALVAHAVRAWLVPAFSVVSPMVRLAALACFVDLLRRPVSADDRWVVLPASTVCLGLRSIHGLRRFAVVQCHGACDVSSTHPCGGRARCSAVGAANVPVAA
jgi:hypothetical protein